MDASRSTPTLRRGVLRHVRIPILAVVLLVSALAGTTTAAAANPSSVLAAPGWSGWTEVPGGGSTFDSPATVQYKNKLYVFVRGTDDKIYRNRYGGGTWSGWTEVPGDGRDVVSPVGHDLQEQAVRVRAGHQRRRSTATDTTAPPGRAGQRSRVVARRSRHPGATAYKNKLYVFVRGTDDKIYRNRYNGTWSGWAEVPGDGVTQSAPGATAYKSKLYLFVRGTDNAIYRNRYDGTSWSGWTEVSGGGSTESAPGATAYKDKLYLFVRGTDGKIYRNRYAGTWSGWAEVPGDGLTPSAPAATTYKGKLYVFVRATNDAIYRNRYSN